MNYRHAYHAGNAGDCLKHALLVWLIGALCRKPAPFTVLDTHAGTGGYDLSGVEAEATGEWCRGIARLRAHPDAALAPYLALAPNPAQYPGSPALARALLRPQDRLICCELHEADAATLHRRFAADPQTAVHRRDGYQALTALLPPATARGLVLIDPPYEQPHELDRVADGLRTAHRRFRAGVLAAWYPIKHLPPIRAFRHSLAATLPDVVSAQLTLRPPLDPQRLNGSGLVVVSPPYGFEAAARAILHALAERLCEPGGTFALERWSDE